MVYTASILLCNSITVTEFSLFPDINECFVPAFESNLCVNAQCINTNGSFKCVCHPGFISDRRNNCLGKEHSVTLA